LNAREHRRQATRTSATAPGFPLAARDLVPDLAPDPAPDLWARSVPPAVCGNSAPHGPPVLQQVYWETHGGVQTLVWSSIRRRRRDHEFGWRPRRRNSISCSIA